MFQNDEIQEDEEIVDDLPSSTDNRKNEGGATVNMGSVVTNPKIVNNQTKMPAVETSKLGSATLVETQFANNSNSETMNEINKKISKIKP